MTKIESQKIQYHKAVLSLEKAYEKYKNTKEDIDTYRDSVVQRFEFCFDLAWKALKTILLEKGVICNTPRDCFENAYSAKLIDNEEIWIKTMKTRNTLSHLYDEDSAKESVLQIPEFIENFKKLKDIIE